MQKLVFYLIAPLIPVLSLAVVAVGSGSNLMDAGGDTDPFAPYEAMMPGQPVMAAGDQPCEPQIVPGYVDAISCEVRPTDRQFELVTAHVSNGKFVHIEFSANNLYIGDIVRHWGRPDVMTKDHQAFYVFWYNKGLYGIIDLVGQIGRLNYMQPVESLTIGLLPQS